MEETKYEYQLIMEGMQKEWPDKPIEFAHNYLAIMCADLISRHSLIRKAAKKQINVFIKKALDQSTT
ncbi:MAG: hypothetical protein [Microvirus sp.]|nr:MAG: hypothetical protein [Microvirus sp.]